MMIHSIQPRNQTIKTTSEKQKIGNKIEDKITKFSKDYCKIILRVK